MFVLLARDPWAAVLVELWAACRARDGVTSPEQMSEARDLAADMRRWRAARGMR